MRWECVAPSWWAMPLPPRKTIGILYWPPDMYFTLAALLTIWSMQTQVNDQLMNSMIGRRPMQAAPTPRPEKAASEIGVAITRRGPYLSSMPSETLYAPLYWATSSPIRKTFSSRSISPGIAWRRACRNWIAGMVLSCRRPSARDFPWLSPGAPALNGRLVHVHGHDLVLPHQLNACFPKGYDNRVRAECDLPRVVNL